MHTQWGFDKIVELEKCAKTMTCIYRANSVFYNNVSHSILSFGNSHFGGWNSFNSVFQSQHIFGNAFRLNLFFKTSGIVILKIVHWRYIWFFRTLEGFRKKSSGEKKNSVWISYLITMTATTPIIIVGNTFWILINCQRLD